MQFLSRLISQWFRFIEIQIDRLRENLGISRRREVVPALNRQMINLDARQYATVIIPALNEANRIAEVVAFAMADPATAEVIVIDDSSLDNTANLAIQAGAKVYTSSMLGKGASMKDGVAFAQSQILVYLDGDLTGLRQGLITDLCAPLLRGDADFVKASFGRGGGRVTELTAKPMLKVFFPEIAYSTQPLGGIIAARKQLLQSLDFEDGYGVDIGLVLDAHLAGARLAQVDIGSLAHDSQPLQDLTLMANEIARVIFSRAKAAGRLHPEQIASMYETQRQAASGIQYVLTRRKGRQRLLLLDMDGTLTASRFVEELAKATGQEENLMGLLDNDGDAVTRSERIAQLFQYVHKKKFEQVARELAIRPGVIEFVKQMRRRGFMVGVVSDSYFVAAETIRRRIFADFAMAHTLCFENEVCNGKLRINPAFLLENQDLPTSNSSAEICKSNVLRHFLNDKNDSQIELTWAIGDNLNDMALLRMVNRAFVIEPKSSALTNIPNVTEIKSFEELLQLLPNHELVQIDTN